MAFRNARLRAYSGLHLDSILRGMRAIREECRCAHATLRCELIRRKIPTRHRQRIEALGDDVMLRLIHESQNQISRLAKLLRVCPWWMTGEAQRRGLWEPMGKRLLAGMTDDDLRRVVWNSRGIHRAARRLGVAKETVRKEGRRRGMGDLTGVWMRASPTGALRRTSDADLEAAILKAGSPLAACGGFGVSHPAMYAELRRRGLGRLRVQHLVRRA